MSFTIFVVGALVWLPLALFLGGRWKLGLFGGTALVAVPLLLGGVALFFTARNFDALGIRDYDYFQTEQGPRLLLLEHKKGGSGRKGISGFLRLDLLDARTGKRIAWTTTSDPSGRYLGRTGGIAWVFSRESGELEAWNATTGEHVLDGQDLRRQSPLAAEGFLSSEGMMAREKGCGLDEAEQHVICHTRGNHWLSIGADLVASQVLAGARLQEERHPAGGARLASLGLPRSDGSGDGGVVDRPPPAPLRPGTIASSADGDLVEYWSEVGSKANDLLLLSLFTKGEVQWTLTHTELGDRAIIGAVPDDGGFLVMLGDSESNGRVLSLDARTGAVRWSY